VTDAEPDRPVTTAPLGPAPPAWWRRWANGRVADVVFAVGVFLFFSALQHGALRHDLVAVGLMQIGLVAPLAWRRRAPVAVFGVVAAVAFAQWLANIRLPSDAALLIALYTVAAYRDRRRTLAAFGVLELGITLVTLRWSMHDRGVATFVSLSAMAVAATVIGSNVRARREQMEFLEDRAVRLERERDQREQLAVAGERSRIAREMHDIVTHNLSVMVALADGAAFAQDRAPQRAAAAMRQVSATGRQAITDMRRFLGVLRADEPDALRHPMPGIAQLDALAEQVRAAGLPTRLEVAGEPSAVPVAAQLTAFRLVQEALTNTLKHAPAGTRADVRVACASDALTLTVTDDGPGAAPRPPSDDPARSAGHGLAGMRERAAAYGGRLTAGPLPGGGWQVAAVLALTTPEAL
jgi:signal transduction histidine kinase